VSLEPPALNKSPRNGFAADGGADSEEGATGGEDGGNTTNNPPVVVVALRFSSASFVFWGL
jgi:hypothetical protein